MRALALLRDPVPREKRVLMRERWESLDPGLRTAGQGLGRQATGCGATIGIQPRCDFSCTGCYLGSEANGITPIGVEAACAQLDRLRESLGPKGNAQITDGEATLLPEDHLMTILRHARRIGLVPMLMTHGDSFRRCPGLLERLMVHGGLTEVSVHVDVTQRGRWGYTRASSERDLEPLRDEFAVMIRAARRETGRPLRAAMTMTVTAGNLDDVGAVVEWCLLNRDVFTMVSLQPVAQVGRTRQSLAPVSADALWERVHTVLARYALNRSGPGPLQFGHPDCTRLELLVVCERANEPPRAVPVVRDHCPDDLRMLSAFFDRGFGGINFRDDSAIERVCRAIGVVLSDPAWIAGPLRRWFWARLREIDTRAPRLVFDALRGRVRVSSFAVVSHHFMTADELQTPVGRERLAACAFRVPVGADLVPMCQVNAGGVRTSVYARSTG